jgi:hypothetical protein
MTFSSKSLPSEIPLVCSCSEPLDSSSLFFISNQNKGLVGNSLTLLNSSSDTQIWGKFYKYFYCLGQIYQLTINHDNMLLCENILSEFLDTTCQSSYIFIVTGTISIIGTNIFITSQGVKSVLGLVLQLVFRIHRKLCKSWSYFCADRFWVFDRFIQIASI